MEVKKSNNILEIKSKINLYLPQFFGYSSLAIISLYFTILSIIYLNFYLINLFYLFIFFVSSFLSIWYIFGSEKLIINTTLNELEIVRSNYLVTRSKKHQLNKIKKVEFYIFKDNFFHSYLNYVKESQRAFFWLDMGRIYFFTGVDKISILNGLNEEDTKKAFLLINEILKDANR